MSESLKLEIQELINKLNLDCEVEEFQDKVNWYYISINEKLSEEFIRYFIDKFSLFNWYLISINEKLSEEFICEFQDKVNFISTYQKLSEGFIRESEDKVD